MMPDIQAVQRTVYRAPSRGRCYLTAKAAARAEAAAMIVKKYPTERIEFDDVGCTDRGFHWSSDSRLVAVHERLSRIIQRRLNSVARTTQNAKDGG